jgi:mono/diheme cytochrome c family protein
MLRKMGIFVVASIVVAIATFWIVTIPDVVRTAALPAYTPDIANGRTIFNAGGCSSCHAVPAQADRTLLGGGLAITTSFGTLYAPNISPDPAHGIGRWSEGNFVSAMWKGTSPRRTHYYPVFPYASYQYIKLDDVRDLFAYLRTLPPSQEKSRDADMHFPFGFRRPLAIWKWIYIDGKPFTPGLARTAAWNRGAYLVNGPGHCAECHSPRNQLGGIIEGQRFAGGPNPEGEGWIPNITQKRLSQWTQADFEVFLESGEMPDGDAAGGSMAPVIRNISQLSAEDRTAMAIYLKSLAPVDGPEREKDELPKD